MREKQQTPAQRVTNPVWLRDQITKLVRECSENIEEDSKLAQTERVEVHCHWKRQLERILRGKTAHEDLCDFLQQEGMC